MKATANIHNVEHYENRSNVTLNIVGYGNEFVALCNKVTAICRKHNAQQNLYLNASHSRYDKYGNFIGFTTGNSGGTITFHSHSCNPEEAVQELLNSINKGKATLLTKPIIVEQHAIVFEKLIRDNRPNLVEFGKTEFLKSINHDDCTFEKTKDAWTALIFPSVEWAQKTVELLEKSGYTVDIYTYGTPYESKDTICPNCGKEMDEAEWINNADESISCPVCGHTINA